MSKTGKGLGPPEFCRLENRKVVVGNPTLRVAATDDSRQPRVNSFGKRNFIVYNISKIAPFDSESNSGPEPHLSDSDSQY